MKNIVASAGSKEGLERLINEFYYSNGYYIDENIAIQHSSNKAYSGQGKVEVKRNRWHFYFER